MNNTHSVFACSCIEPRTPAEELNASSAAFTGQVTDIVSTSEHEYKVIFAVEKSWKGVSGKTVNVLTGLGGGDCGYSFKIGEKYLVYAFGSAGNLNTNICSRTKLLGDAQEDLIMLLEWKIYKLSVKDQVFRIPYKITTANIEKIEAEFDFTTVVANIQSDSRNNGKLEITIPMELISSNTGDEQPIVLVDGEEVDYIEVSKSPCFRTLSIDFDAGAKTIEIIMGQLTVAIPKAVPPSVYVTTDKSNYEIDETTTVSGCTSLALNDKEVMLEALDPQGKIYTIPSVVPNVDGSFSTSLVIVGQGAINGTYAIKATYAGHSTINSFVVPEFSLVLLTFAAIITIVILLARNKGPFVQDAYHSSASNFSLLMTYCQMVKLCLKRLRSTGNRSLDEPRVGLYMHRTKA